MKDLYADIPAFDDIMLPLECNCEFTALKPEDEDYDATDPPNYGGWHYKRRCLNCNNERWSLHCPHDGIQSRCECGTRFNQIG